MSYIDRLIQNCEAAKRAVAVKQFELTNLSDLDGIKSAVYIIQQIGGDIEETFSDFKIYKKLKIRSCPKYNTPSTIMYVGSSTTGIIKRIKEHYGDGHKHTYALQLNHWFKGNYKITIMQYEEPKEVLQIIEDDLSDKLKPAFGKRGGNNK